VDGIWACNKKPPVFSPGWFSLAKIFGIIFLQVAVGFLPELPYFPRSMLAVGLPPLVASFPLVATLPRLEEVVAEVVAERHHLLLHPFRWGFGIQLGAQSRELR
jgi:hypothetical protein